MMFVVQVTTKTTVFVEAKNEEEARLMACVKAPAEDPDGVDAVVIDKYNDDWSGSV